MKETVINFWDDVIYQNEDKLRTYFMPNAIIKWHNTNECFTKEEYIIANCEYPGKWCGEVEKIEVIGDMVISVTRVWSEDNRSSHHATSFIKFFEGKIITLDEYWGEDGVAPQWRLDKKIGKTIK